MKFKGIFTTSFLLKSIFILSLFILVFISSVTYKHAINLSASTDLLVHSYKTQIELEQLISYIKDAEANQRSFFLSNDTSFLNTYNTTPDKIKKIYVSLKLMTSQDERQQRNLDSLFRLIGIRYALLKNSMDLQEDSVLNKAEFDKNIQQGIRVMESIRNQINTMIAFESMNFEEHQKKYEREITFTPVFTLLLFLFPLIVFVFSYIKINRDVYFLKESNEDLLIAVESIKHAEKIGEFFTSVWDSETNQITYSDNLYALLGVELNSFEPSIENFLKFVHPDDKRIVIMGAEKLKDNITYPRYYRIIRKDGELRYFRSVGKFIPGKDNVTTHIGITKDVTEYQISNNRLEEKNFELEQSIKELEAFNRVASHDLQEPLRKVQTFISRFSEKDLERMSETGREYFIKIQASIGRMRTLIDDLLLFSRTGKYEKVIIKTDLNLLFENVKLELAQDIEEKNATLTSANLPSLKVIPFQIQQLFLNLIGNSLKYSQPDVPPVIRIEYEKVTADPLVFKSSTDKYHKISVIDNGIGFDEKYTESIFRLFYRLHQKTEFPGTGIGLSICKKIVDNHNGIITAKSSPGKGSVFMIFLPQ